MTLFLWPPPGKVERPVTKKKIFEQNPPGKVLRNLFTKQVDKIIWGYKLAASTVNLGKSPEVPEIHVFILALKSSELHYDVLRFLDKLIPFPLIFELHHDNQIKMVATPKRPSASENNKWVVCDYFSGPWLPASTERTALPVALNLKGLYEALLTPLLPAPPKAGETLAETAARLAQVTILEKKIAGLAARLDKEKQFNRKVEMNNQLKALKQELTNFV